MSMIKTKKEVNDQRARLLVNGDYCESFYHEVKQNKADGYTLDEIADMISHRLQAWTVDKPAELDEVTRTNIRRALRWTR